MAIIFSYGIAAGLATTLGSLLFLFIGFPGRRVIAFALGLASGVMLAVVGLDLIPSALSCGGWVMTAVGFGCGWMLIRLADQLLGTIEKGDYHTPSAYRRLGILTAMGIALHDLPEGMAIALGYAAAERLGPIIAVAIGLHNIPEGIATTAPLRAARLSVGKILLTNLLLALVTPIGTAMGLFLAHTLPSYFEWMLGLASGTMIYLVATALGPSAYRLHFYSALCGTCLGIIMISIFNKVI